MSLTARMATSWEMPNRVLTWSTSPSRISSRCGHSSTDASAAPASTGAGAAAAFDLVAFAPSPFTSRNLGVAFFFLVFALPARFTVLVAIAKTPTPPRTRRGSSLFGPILAPRASGPGPDLHVWLGHWADFGARCGDLTAAAPLPADYRPRLPRLPGKQPADQGQHGK